ncbi:MAG: NADH-quinone oxidoreductase subunit H, partial [Candidatus Aenigmarchaeota archaeon]|nr:NADH-quinone oxidoreductase subunit H [Candidatus Aenigmarchaeota archaeon]
CARMQNRVGPPILQAFYDAIKLFGKENLSHEGAGHGFFIWPIIAFASAIMAALLIPVAGTVALNAGDLLIIIYFLILSSAALYMAGFSSENPYAIIGASRGFMQMIAYEAPFILAILFPVFFYQSMSLSYFNQLQLSNGLLALQFPVAAFAFLVAVLGKVELAPFHIPAAHQELVGGYYIEFSGFRLAMVELTHAVKTVALLALGVALFFGGSASILGFVAKTLVLLFLLAVFRATLARFRIEQAIWFYWTLAGVLVINLTLQHGGFL